MRNLLVGIILLFATNSLFAQVNIEAVYAPKNFSNMSNRYLVLDNSGYPHVVYGQKDLYHSWYNGVSWQHEVIDDSENNVGQGVSAVFKGSRLYVSYYDESAGDLKFAYNVGDDWYISTVDSEENAGSYSSISIEPLTSNVHIVYTKTIGGNTGLRHATRGSNPPFWSTMEIIPGTVGTTIGQVSSVLDAGAKLHISYFHDGDVKYVTNVNGSWENDVVDDDIWNEGVDAVYPYDTAIVQNSSGAVYIGYAYGAEVWDWDANDYIYSTNWLIATPHPEFTWWTKDTLGSSDEDISGHISLNRLGAGIQVVHSYEAGVKYTTASYSGGWSIGTKETIPTSGETYYTSARVASDDTLHVAYYDSVKGALVYGAHPSSSWALEEVAYNGVTQADHQNIASDSNGNQHICYLESQGDQTLLRYATRSGSLWLNETVDVNITADGQGCDIEVDASGHPWIAYMKDNGIWLVDKTGSSWGSPLEIVSGAARPAIFIDDADVIHMAYVDGGTLMYANNEPGHWGVMGDTHQTVVSGMNIVDMDIIKGGDGVYISFNELSTVTWEYSLYLHKVGNPSALFSDTADDVGRYHSLGIASDGMAHLAYIDTTNRKLKIASGTTSLVTTVLDDAYHSAPVALDTDRRNKVHILYSALDGSGAKYITNQKGSWKSTTLVETGTSGGVSQAISIDAKNRLYGSYIDSNGERVMLMHFPLSTTLVPVIMYLLN